MKNSIFYTYVRPRKSNEDDKRREFILNILLIAGICLLLLAHLVSLIDGVAHPETYPNSALSIGILSILLLGTIILYICSRRGYINFPSFVLITCIYLLATYMIYNWGFDVPAATLFYILVIIMTGILLNSRAAFFVASIIAVSMFVVGYLQIENILKVNTFWKANQASYSDIAMTVALFSIVATISWLSNREIEKSLIRARASEASLKEERDLLEIRVRERTEELQKVELERMAQAYRFVEFGRLAGSIFHDLANPLTALSFNIESIARNADTHQQLTSIAEDISRAQGATTHMLNLMESMRKHLAKDGRGEVFGVDVVINEVIHILESYARENNVLLHSELLSNIKLYGDPIAFMQIITNIISNAIQAFSRTQQDELNKRVVRTKLLHQTEGIIVIIEDTGPGITREIQDRIFEPFFSTRSATGGLGLGLPITKRLLEKEFKGTLSVSSEIGKGTIFSLRIPIQKDMK